MHAVPDPAPTAASAQRLTDTLLDTDLPCAITTLDDEIDYLTGAITHATAEPLAVRFTHKRDCLQRARAYLRGLVDAEILRRRHPKPTSGDPE